MNSLAETQNAFMRFLLKGDGDVASIITGGDDVGNSRLTIYHNAYRARLREALETDHDMLWIYLGDELFAEMVGAYIDAHPSSLRSLRHFGNALPSFLANREPFDSVPAIAELATFERLLMDVFDAASAPRLDLVRLREVPPEAWPELRLQLHPSARLFEFRSNAVDIWKALKAGKTPPECMEDTQRWLIWRSRERLSEFMPLDPLSFELLIRAQKGASFADMCSLLAEHVQLEQGGAAWMEYLCNWLDIGLVSGVNSEGK